MALMDIKNLTIRLRGSDKSAAPLVHNADFTLEKGETLAIVGESGSGKTLSALSLMRLLPPALSMDAASRITLQGEELTSLADKPMRRLRGERMAMIFQEPMTALNPLHRIGRQIGEMLQLHPTPGAALSKDALKQEIISLLHKVGLQGLENRLDAYPHQLSGGQRQRVMIAMAIANKPDLLIADEPTTALDVTVQQQILGLLKELQQESGMGLLLITHDLTLVRKMADRVAVMQRGEVVETAPTRQIFASPQHAYTRFLLEAEPKGRNDNPVKNDKIALQGNDISVHFTTAQGFLGYGFQQMTAVDNISLTLHAGEVIGIVGESGSGKTTLGMALLRLLKSEGAIAYNGQAIDGHSIKQMRPLRRQLQVVFQDPFASLNPRMPIGDIVSEGMRVHGLAANKQEEQQKVASLLEEVGLSADMASRYPHEFSGGQRQRVSIARALALNPDVLLLDEPTSALDLATQTQILELLKNLQSKYSLSLLFISHDLRVIRAIAHRILVMKDGQIVEQGTSQDIIERPQEEYTKALIEAAFASAA